MSRLATLLADPTADWARHAPAPAAALAALGAAFPALPPDYLAFLALSNGGEGELGVEPGWFALWPAEEVAALNASYDLLTVLPGFTGFGSNGGGELLAFGPGAAVYRVPFIPLAADDAIAIAPDFTTFAEAFGRLLDAI